MSDSSSNRPPIRKRLFVGANQQNEKVKILNHIKTCFLFVFSQNEYYFNIVEKRQYRTIRNKYGRKTS